MMSRLRSLAGAVSLSTMLTMGGGLVTGVAGGIIWVQDSISSAVTPVQTQTEANTESIAAVQVQLSSINTKLDFILGEYGARYSNTSGRIVVATTTP